MKRRSSVFDSAAERAAFRALESRWSERLRLYPQLPLAKLIELESGDLDPQQRRYFYNTNVDYTFCNLDDRPLFSIEYDGIGGGLSVGTEYKPKRTTGDPRRQEKLNLKLAATAEASYPLLVISVDELQSLDADDEFTILDGIVGNMLQHSVFPGLAQAMVEEADLEVLTDSVRDEIIEDIVSQAELIAELDNDPLARRALELEYEAGRLGAITRSCDWLFDPELPDLEPVWPPSAEEVLARSEAMDTADRVGCRVVVDIPSSSVPRIIRTAWMRNIQAPGVFASGIAQTMARYFAYKQVVELVRTASLPA